MKDLRKIENAHVALWLMKDLSWCQQWIGPGLVMILPTLVIAAVICWKSRRDREDLIHNVAVLMWICANITWMIGEFFFHDGTRNYARVFFYAGMSVLIWHYAGVFWEFVQRRGRGPLKANT